MDGNAIIGCIMIGIRYDIYIYVYTEYIMYIYI